MDLLWRPDLYAHVAAQVAEIRLHGVRDLGAQIRQLDGLASQLPLVPLVRLDDVRLVEVRVGLRAAVALRHRLLDHLALVLALSAAVQEIA